MVPYILKCHYIGLCIKEQVYHLQFALISCYVKRRLPKLLECFEVCIAMSTETDEVMQGIFTTHIELPRLHSGCLLRLQVQILPRQSRLAGKPPSRNNHEDSNKTSS
jgi:hypothetical protein